MIYSPPCAGRAQPTALSAWYASTRMYNTHDTATLHSRPTHHVPTATLRFSVPAPVFLLHVRCGARLRRASCVCSPCAPCAASAPFESRGSVALLSRVDETDEGVVSSPRTSPSRRWRPWWSLRMWGWSMWSRNELVRRGWLRPFHGACESRL